MDTNRRKFLRLGSIGLASIPIVAVSETARATTNPTVRAQLKYQDTPKDDAECSTCLEFIAGKTSTALGGCKQIPGDDEISPKGYCTAWNTL